MSHQHIAGMDFGTSNSTVGIVGGDGIEMVPLEHNSATGKSELTLPSAVFFPFEHDDIAFGRAAIGEYTDGERGRFMRSMKSILGTSLMEEGTNIKGKQHDFPEIIAYFIQHLKDKADAHARLHGGADLTSVVMGRPVRFSDDDDALDQAAENVLAEVARSVGFRDVSFQFEPIAAAYDYESTLSNDEIVMIVDIGGGTSDFSVIQLRAAPDASADRGKDILANHGVHIGGTDFDQQLSMQTVMPFFGMNLRQKLRPELPMPRYFYSDFSTWHRLHFLYELPTLLNLKSFIGLMSDPAPIARFVRAVEQKQGHQIAAVVEASKISLATAPSVAMDLSFIEDDAADDVIAGYELLVEQSTFEQAIEASVQRLSQCMEETLLRAGMAADKIDTVFLTGGSTAVPAIQQLVQSTFQHARQVNTDRFCSVGRGLTIEAMRRYG